MTALSPLASWLLFLICVGIGATVYIVVAGGHRYRRIWQEFDETRTSVYPEDAHIRIFGGPYDHETRGDFE
jgi:hypothetical protein